MDQVFVWFFLAALSVAALFILLTQDAEPVPFGFRSRCRLLGFAGQDLRRYLRARRQAFVLQTAATLRRWAFHRFTRIDRNAKCPGCGHRSGRIEFSPEHRLLVHVCLICCAQWGEQPVVAADHWLAHPHATQISEAFHA